MNLVDARRAMLSCGRSAAPIHDESHPDRMDHDWDKDNFRDLPLLLAEITRRQHPRDGDVVVALVRDPQGSQEIVSIDLLELPLTADVEPARTSIRHLMERVPITDEDERDRACRPLTLMARRGYAVFTRPEANWTTAWHSSNHFRHTMTSDFVLITEHGWYDLMSGTAASQPSL
jgi:hypothetical protein